MIVQHRRERFHPFNTARILRKSLRRSQLLSWSKEELLRRSLPIPAGAGLLFPGATAEKLSDLPESRRPRHLVVIDGTWHQAKTYLRDLPQLRALPRFRIDPKQPGRYRIRREPTKSSLSTLEATVAALRVLEPKMTGLDSLNAVFEFMIDQQINHESLQSRPRIRRRRQRAKRAIPSELIDNPQSIVVANAESTPGGPGVKSAERDVLVWVARRLATGEEFSCCVQTECELSDEFLAHLQLPRHRFDSGVAQAELHRRWNEFLRPGESVVVFHPATERLFSPASAPPAEWYHLKSIYFNLGYRFSLMEELLEQLGIVAAKVSHDGRAGQRLDDAQALLLKLTELAVKQRAPGRTP